MVAAIRQAGARIRFLLDGDVAGAIMAVTPGTGVDLLVGVGGTPEGVLAACALRCLGGEMVGRLIARDDAERHKILDAGFDLGEVLTTQDLVSGDNVFFAATGVTDGALLRGVRFESHRVITQSLSMRSRLRDDPADRRPARSRPVLLGQLLSGQPHPLLGPLPLPWTPSASLDPFHFRGPSATGPRKPRGSKVMSQGFEAVCSGGDVRGRRRARVVT